MPCYKCNNGKYKYGERGRCQFDTLGGCEAAERAVHAQQNKAVMKHPYFENKNFELDENYPKPYND